MPEITKDALSTLIESQDAYGRILRGEIKYQCGRLPDAYSASFRKQDISHALLHTPKHSFLAVPTSDSGVLIFDPTFKQLYPNASYPYFLGSPQELQSYMNAHQAEFTYPGKPSLRHAPGPTAMECFTGFEIIPGMAGDITWLSELKPLQEMNSRSLTC